MTARTELESKLRSLTDDEYRGFRKEFGGAESRPEDSTPLSHEESTRFVDNLLKEYDRIPRPDWAVLLLRHFGITPDEERAAIFAERAEERAGHAERRADISLWISGLSAFTAIAAVVVSVLVAILKD